MDPIKETAEQAVTELGWAYYMVPEVLQPLIKAFEDDHARPFMVGIAILFILGVVIIVERVYMFTRVYRADAASLMQKIQRLILENNIDEAIKICNTNKRAGIYQIFKAALMNADRPYEEIQDHVEVATMAFVPKLQMRMPYLFTISNVSTLLGLLGTVMGLLAAFSAVGTFEGSQKQLALSAGIGLALNTTAFGLISAIPAMLAYGWLYNAITAMLDEIEHYTGKLLLLLRTGSQYYEKFSSDSSFTTQQRPQKLNPESLPPGVDESSYDPGRATHRAHAQQSYAPPPVQEERSAGTQYMERPPLVERPVPAAPPQTFQPPQAPQPAIIPAEKRESTRSRLIRTASVVSEDDVGSTTHSQFIPPHAPTPQETQKEQGEDDLLDEYLGSKKDPNDDEDAA